MSKKYYEAECSIDSLPFCCGAIEIGDLADFTQDENEYGHYHESLKEAWEAQLEKIRFQDRGKPLVINFVKEEGDRTFIEKEFRQVVRDQKDCLFVHRWVNPSTRNTLEMYVLTNKKGIK